MLGRVWLKANALRDRFPRAHPVPGETVIASNDTGADPVFWTVTRSEPLERSALLIWMLSLVVADDWACREDPGGWLSVVVLACWPAGAR